MSLNLFNRVVSATTQFGLPTSAEIYRVHTTACPFCGLDPVKLTASGTIEQHISAFPYSFYVCEASGKTAEQAAKLRIDDNFNIVGDDDLNDDDVSENL